MRIISRVKIRALRPDEMPEGLGEMLIHIYTKTNIKNAYRMRWYLEENNIDIDTIVEQVIKPNYENLRKRVNPNLITRSGLTAEQALACDRAGMERQAEKYLEKLKQMPDLNKLIDDLRYKSKWYIRKMFERVIPFKGYKDMVAGVGPMAARWLTGDQGVLAFIPREDIELGGPVDIRRPDGAGKFRMKLINTIVTYGNRIVRTNYHPASFAQANDALAEVVRQHARNEFEVEIKFVLEAGDLWLEIEVR